MKAAFACWDNRIAPVFDTARRILVIEVESGRVVREGQVALPGDPPSRKALHLAEAGIGMLVCGAISRPLHGLVASHGIRVIPFVAGDLRQIVGAWLEGNLSGDAFAMPGCRGRGGPRRGRGSCNRTMRGWNMAENDEEKKGSCTGAAGDGSADSSGAAAGPSRCVCYQCGHRATIEAGVPCRLSVCPRCGGEMGRE